MGEPRGHLEAHYKMKIVCVSVSVCTSLKLRATRHELTICLTRQIDILWNTRDTVHGAAPAVGCQGTYDDVFGRRVDLSRPLTSLLEIKGTHKRTSFFLRLQTHAHTYLT